jgi:GNAT superfamily N-acetyltransferase
MSAVTIRPALEEDTPTILEMIRALAEYERLSHLVVANVERLRASLFGARPAAEVLLAIVGAECVGFALFFQTYSTFLAAPGLYLEDLFVKPEWRGKSIGYSLLLQLAKLAQERSCGRVEWSVLDWNEPSIEFYKRLGAVPLDDWTTYRLQGDALQKVAGTSLPDQVEIAATV